MQEVLGRKAFRKLESTGCRDTVFVPVQELDACETRSINNTTLPIFSDIIFSALFFNIKHFVSEEFMGAKTFLQFEKKEIHKVVLVVLNFTQ